METPVFWLVTQETRVKLMQLQWELYGTKLDIPPESSFKGVVHGHIEPLEEIDREMRKAPSRSRGD